MITFFRGAVLSVVTPHDLPLFEPENRQVI